MKLVICEKPSQAQAYAAVLGANKREDGFFITGNYVLDAEKPYSMKKRAHTGTCNVLDDISIKINEGGGYIVSWCVGHLVALAEAVAYDEKYAVWKREDLPILPAPWKNIVLPGTKKQYDILKKLMNSPEVKSIVCATDAGREGELIFRLVYEKTGCKKPVERLWISSMEESAIREGFQNLKPNAEYDRLYQAALCRAQADWLVGINATRLFSTLYHRTLNIGRVMTPTLALIAEREAEIAAFEPKAFYTVDVVLSDFTVSSDRMEDRAEAEAMASACMEANTVTVKSAERKEKREKPPALYDLTTLQREANRLLGYTAQQTLDYVQSLYEKKLCTHPRTDSRYLSLDMDAGLPVLINHIAKVMPFAHGFKIMPRTKQVINDSRVADHHAIIPTNTVSEAALTTLPTGERSVLELIAARLLCAVSQSYKYAETTVTMECAGHNFTAKGRAVLNFGWKELDRQIRVAKDDEEKDTGPKPLPVPTEGEVFDVVVADIREGKTSPPKHFTEDSILAAMETAGAKEAPEDAERKGFGTPATRAAILEKLVKVGFIERKKSKKTVHLMPTQAGNALITIVPEQIQSPSMTAEWEHRLKQIEHGEAQPEAFMRDISAMVTELVQTSEIVPGAEVLFPSKHENVGKCPRCGSVVFDKKKGFFCESPNCKFAIWKDNKWFAMKKKAPTTETVKALLKDGRVKLTGLFSEKTGKSYDAVVVMEDTGTFVNFKLEFEGGTRK